MKYFNFEGARIVYEDLGKGKPVILVHGAVVAQPWGKFKPMLAKNRRVVAIHLPGFGNSEVVPGKIHDTELFARVVCDLAHWLELETAPVVALSLGTVVSLKAAQKGGLKGKLLLAGIPTHTRGVMVSLSHWLPRLLLRQIVRVDWIREKILMGAIRVNVGRHREELGWAKRFSAKINQTSPEAIADVDYVSTVQQVPSLLDEVANEKICVYGQYDVQKKFAGQMGISYTLIKKSGHDVFSDQPEEMVGMVRSRL